MSTIFGIHKFGKNFELEDDCLPKHITYFDEDFITVAFRGNTSGIKWKNDLASFLPHDMKVYALDNTQQGIYTIGDIHNMRKSQGLYP